MTFINQRLAKEMQLKHYKFEQPIPLLNIDGTKNTAGRIPHYAQLHTSITRIGGHPSKDNFAITELDDEDIIIGIDWLQKHNPAINWKEGILTLKCCARRNKYEDYPFTAKRTKKTPRDRRTYGYRQYKAKVLKDLPWALGEERKYDIRASKSQQLAINAMDKKEKTFEEMVPKAYRHYKDIFSKSHSDRMPEHKPWDLEIDIKEGKELPKPKKAFPMSPREYEALKEFLKQETQLGRIRPSKSETARRVFFIKKKDGKLRFVQDYRALNEVTVKNRYPIPRSSELIDQLREAKYFSHLDLRNGYNNVRIKEGHEHKLAFQTPLGLYEPLVMYFGMTNAPGAFQALMNHIFHDMIMAGKLVVYLDDIMIYANTLEEHRVIVLEVLR